MLDHQIQLSSFIPTYQRHNSPYDSTADTEFDFWASCRSQSYYGKINHIGGSDAELEVEPHASRSIEYEPSSPLLPRNHHFSSISPKSRMRALAEGRKELMEMIANMPESSYELSLKDIVVDQQHIMQEVQEDIQEETSFHFETEAQLKKEE
ncbi:uncharacterized protein LOC119990845 [Tripterygium wilfordii]|uniref:uncharacterized protein LOC119990845 n=1 Tax=Tripterygium wilfordii TaxID=458696 RepID=UPI0018F82E43|nr:uncharacterized protein LOC119990845 [Tripterygium wilfordii]